MNQPPTLDQSANSPVISLELLPLRLTLKNQKRQKSIILSINQMNLLRTGPVKDRGSCQSLLLIPIV